MRTAWTGMDSIRLAMETQGAMLADVTSQMHTAEEEVKSLKRSANREDTIPGVKCFCADETVRQLVRLNKEKRLSAKRAASHQPGKEEKSTCTSRRTQRSNAQW